MQTHAGPDMDVGPTVPMELCDLFSQQERLAGFPHQSLIVIFFDCIMVMLYGTMLSLILDI